MKTIPLTSQLLLLLHLRFHLGQAPPYLQEVQSHLVTPATLRQEAIRVQVVALPLVPSLVMVFDPVPLDVQQSQAFSLMVTVIVIAAAIASDSAFQQLLILKQRCFIRCPFAHQLSMRSPDPFPRFHLITSLFALAFEACVVTLLSTPPYHHVQRANLFVTCARLSF